MSAPSQTHRVTFAATAATTATATTGLPQVSVLTFKKQKDLAKKRREALLAGKGKSYRGIGTHRRSTTKHTWTYGELAELSAVFMEHCERKPIWKMTEEIRASFAAQLRIKKDQAAASVVVPADEEQVAELREPRTHLPTVAAIENKLMDCASLKIRDISKPSLMHCEVWTHLLRAQKHRTMIRDMTTNANQQQQDQQQQQHADEQANEEREIWNVHASEFMYDTVAEYETAFPPAKRRKLDFSSEEVVVGEIDMSDVLEALEEIAAEVETREQARQQQNAAISLSMAIIRQNQQDIEILLEYMGDTQSGMELCQRRINAEMAKIDAIVQSNSSTASAPASTPASAPASTPASATATTTAQVGPLTLTANSQFDPNDYRCRECKEMFDPRNGGYWLIGPNHETGDTFYLCHKCTQFMDTEEMQQTPQTPRTPAQRIDEEEEEEGGDGEGEDYTYNSEDSMNNDDEYDHGEECS
jgi:hypothetical protein